MVIHTFVTARGLIAFGALAVCAATAAAQSPTDQTLSPFFQVATAPGEGGEPFALESTSAEVNIAGVIAAVTIKQTYRNRGRRPIEAVYIFPASTRAAVNAMKMTIGERVVQAKIHKRLDAKATYEKAKREGKRTSLLEQARPNVFRMNVANIMPGDSVQVELAYTELLVPEAGEYGFIYPTVVGPRYNGESATAGANPWVANPHLRQDLALPYRFDIALTIASGVPIQALSSPSHRLTVDYQGPDRASIRLHDADQAGGDRDFILNYRLEGQAIESGLLLHRGEDENYFLFMAQPPKQVAPEQIPAREYIFVVDVSGSMHGFPLDTGKRLMLKLLSTLRPQDSFNILFFAGGSTVLAPRSLPATGGNLRRARTAMDAQRGGGGTRMLAAIKRAMAIPAEAGTARSFVILTDGYVAVETEAFDYVRKHLDQANFFAFGIGSSVNRFLIEGLARAGRGLPFVITHPDEATATADRFGRYIASPVLTGIEVDFGELDVYDVIPETVPDLLAERPLIVFGKWRGEAKGTISVRGQGGRGKLHYETAVPTLDGAVDHAALRYLWARQRIAELGDFHKLSPSDERSREITTLGLSHDLLTAFTSFVAVDSEVANPGGGSDSVKQPLPLPQGVSNHAVGGFVPTAPEPEIKALFAMLAVIALWQLNRRRRTRVSVS